MAQPEVVAVGELIVEIMRKRVDSPLNRPGDFVGLFPSGAPAIFADQVARWARRSRARWKVRPSARMSNG